MNVFFEIMIMILTVSNVLLWLCIKGLSIKFKQLCDQYIKLIECILKESDNNDT